MNNAQVFSNKYIEQVVLRKDSIDFKFMIIIDNETLKTSYSILSNLYCDPFRIAEDYLSTGRYNSKRYRKAISQLKHALSKQVRLVATSNDLYYTRLVYKLV